VVVASVDLRSIRRPAGSGRAGEGDLIGVSRQSGCTDTGASLADPVLDSSPETGGRNDRTLERPTPARSSPVGRLGRTIASHSPVSLVHDWLRWFRASTSRPFTNSTGKRQACRWVSAFLVMARFRRSPFSGALFGCDDGYID